MTPRTSWSRGKVLVRLGDRTASQWHARLTRKGGHPACPGSRYGRDADDCAWWAIACGFIYAEANGFSEDVMDDGYGSYMSMAVNDSDNVAAIVWRYWHMIPRPVRLRLGVTRKEVKDMTPLHLLED